MREEKANGNVDSDGEQQRGCSENLDIFIHPTLAYYSYGHICPCVFYEFTKVPV